MKKMIMTPRRRCFGCKIPLDIRRDEDNSDVIYFDKQFYHKDCFIKAKSVKRKCIVCKEDIVVTSPDDEFIYYDRHCYHPECFKKFCNEKNTKKWKFALENYENYVQEAKKLAYELLAKKQGSTLSIGQFEEDAQNQIKSWFYGSDLCTFVREKYNVLNPQWDLLKSVIDGTYKNIGIGIPAEDLLDMWERKWKYLQKRHSKLIQKNSDVNATALVRYDVAILVNKYDSYLKWKREQHLLAVEMKTEKEKRTKEHAVLQSITQNMVSQNVSSSNNDDLTDLVDDIFD